MRMHEVLRFADPAEAKATLQVRRGDPQPPTTTSPEAGSSPAPKPRCRTPPTRRGSPTSAPAATPCCSPRPPRRSTTLNAGPGPTWSSTGQVAVDGVPLRNGTAAGVGDRVATRRNERRNSRQQRQGLGQERRRLDRHRRPRDGSLTVQHRRHHGHTTLPADYVAQHVELDYARTVRRAQGLTVDHAHLSSTRSMSREEFYVGVSRARHGTQLYVR